MLVEAAVGLLLLRERLLSKQELEQNHPEHPDIHLVGVLPSPRRTDSVQNLVSQDSSGGEKRPQSCSRNTPA